MVSAGVGSVVAGGGFFSSSAAAGMGFWSGAASGAAGGFSGGFVGGAGNSWLNGSNFGQGLGAGLKDGLIGGAIGGVSGGVTSGIKSVKQGNGFFNGKPRPMASLGRTTAGNAFLTQRAIATASAEGDYYSWTGTAPGPNGGSVFRTGRYTGQLPIGFPIPPSIGRPP